MNALDITKTNYKDLPFSKSMKRFFAAHDIPTLEKLLEIKAKDLLEMKWFSNLLFFELTSLLEKHDLTNRLH